MTTWYLIDLCGTGVFAVSGALSALQKKMYHDLFGLCFIGFLTATGGGTLRDIILGAHPIAWIRDPNYLIVILGSVGLAVVGRRWWLGKLRRALLFFDTLGIGIYTILGLQKALSVEVNAWAAVLLGLISAVCCATPWSMICPSSLTGRFMPRPVWREPLATWWGSGLVLIRRLIFFSRQALSP